MSALDASGIDCVALSGGVGGAKLALGLSKVLAPEALLVVANTGDDFDHLGLRICPDLDTLTYTLAGLANPDTGWGRAGETATFMAAMAALGGETWFHLGDADLALHVERTRRLAAGEPLSTITADVAARLGVQPRLLPMSDDPVRTIVEAAEGEIAFQEYFVRRQCNPVVTGFRFDGAAAARPQPVLLGALRAPGLRSVVLCPSNPFISIDPILSLPGVREALAAGPAPVIAVSPIIGGRALKGPTAKMMEELGLDASVLAVARHYGDLLDGFVLDTADAGLAGAVGDLGFRVVVAATVMESLEDRVSLAHVVLDFAGALACDAGI